MAHTNNMGELLDKIEIDLGTDAYNLPDNLSKDNWPKIIKIKTLTSFSRLFPNMINIVVDTTKDKKDEDGYFIIDEDKINGDVKVLGIGDIPWDDPSCLGDGSPYSDSMTGYGIYDMYPAQFGMEDLIDINMIADASSLVNRGIYPLVKQPNKVKLVATSNICGQDLGVRRFKLNVYIMHNINLTTIPPTQMEIFEELATCDIANFLYNKLKFFDNLETVYATMDLHLQELQEIASQRRDILERLKDASHTADNKNMPMIMTLN